MSEIQEIRRLIAKEKDLAARIKEGDTNGQELTSTRIEIGSRLRDANNKGYEQDKEIQKYCQRYADWIGLGP